MWGTKTYLVDSSGQTVHTWNSSARPGLSTYMDNDGTLLRTLEVPGAPAGTQGGAGGVLQRLALDGTLLWNFRYAGGGVWAHHDIEPLPNGNVLMIAWEDKTRAEALAAGRNPLWVSNVFRPNHIIEVQPTGPTSGVIVWQWHLFDHVIQDFSATKANFGVVANHPELVDINFPPSGPPGDWNHVNGIDYDPVHDWIVISSRQNSEIWIIDHSTTTAEAAGHTGGNYGMGGDIIYRWGNPIAYGRGTAANQTLFYQHAANFIPPGYPGAGNILLYNNQPPGGSAAQEFVLPLDASDRFILVPGQAYGPAAPVWSHSVGVQSSVVSSARRAPNGNTLICNGFEIANIIEVTPAGTQVWSHGALGPVFHAHYVENDLWANRSTLSLTPGGAVGFDLIAGSAHAGEAYVMLGSISGTSPGVTLHGHLLPLNPDSYFRSMMSQPNTVPFVQTLGVLDGNGRANASFTLPAGLTFLAGLHIDHAYLTVNPTTLQITRASNAVPLDLVR